MTEVKAERMLRSSGEVGEGAEELETNFDRACPRARQQGRHVHQIFEDWRFYTSKEESFGSSRSIFFQGRLTLAVSWFDRQPNENPEKRLLNKVWRTHNAFFF